MIDTSGLDRSALNRALYKLQYVISALGRVHPDNEKARIAQNHANNAYVAIEEALEAIEDAGKGGAS